MRSGLLFDRIWDRTCEKHVLIMRFNFRWFRIPIPVEIADRIGDRVERERR